MRCLPKKLQKFKNITKPFCIRVSGNGWNNSNIMQEWINLILNEKLVQQQILPKILILDTAPCHTTAQVLSTLKKQDIFPCFIPGGTTSIFQPLDVSINKPVKDYVRKKYVEWLTKKVTDCNLTDKGIIT